MPTKTHVHITRFILDLRQMPLFPRLYTPSWNAQSSHLSSSKNELKNRPAQRCHFYHPTLGHMESVLTSKSPKSKATRRELRRLHTRAAADEGRKRRPRTSPAPATPQSPSLSTRARHCAVVSLYARCHASFSTRHAVRKRLPTDQRHQAVSCVTHHKSETDRSVAPSASLR